jgi:adenine-specific DNA-methyltransferase
VIKYIGSKRRLVPVLAAVAAACGGDRALDLFSGTARVARALKEQRMSVTAVDSAAYAHVLAETYVATDARTVDSRSLDAALAGLGRLEGKPGYFTEVFCRKARFFHPDNGARIDAVRAAIEDRYRGSLLYPLLLTSLLEAADRVDSTAGVQMAYLKSWAPRALRPLELRAPELLPGKGRAVLGDAEKLGRALGHFDIAYLDPPYNQHRYLSNYHVWETLVRFDAPEHYGVACKRIDCKTKVSVFNVRRQAPEALRSLVSSLDARLTVLSYNDESWLPLAELVDICSERGKVAVIGIAYPRYVGARIGIHSPTGERVGTVSHLRNTEMVLFAGERSAVRVALSAGCAAAARTGLESRVLRP